MKPGPVTKPDKENTLKLKKKGKKNDDDDVMLVNCDIIVISLIYAQFIAIRKLDFGRMVCINYFFNNSNLLQGRIQRFEKGRCYVGHHG